MGGNGEPAYEIEAIIREYGNDVLRTACMYVGDYQLAEDIFQEVFIKVNRGLSGFRGDSGLKTWIIRITINTCKDYLKSAYARHVTPVLEPRPVSESGDDGGYERVERSDTNRLVRETVMALPVKYRDIVICVYYHELTVEETAKLLHIASGTVKSRLKRARDKMRPALEGRL